MAESEKEKSEFLARDRWLMLATFIGPMCVLLDEGVNYTLVPTACAAGTKTLLHFITLLFFLAALSGAGIASHYRRDFLDARSEGLLSRERTLWIANFALVLSLVSAVFLVAMEIPNVILRSCD